ncbi:hypothetical protein [Burkholderia sp. MS455]|uniref:hypothetical protein n=1 Tax=Burkholderia sp. MS455 TaxID=2811788 RepID=UPI001959F98E|nr:hypothetical protein [Burkholderia sp. MS455]
MTIVFLPLRVTKEGVDGKRSYDREGKAGVNKHSEHASAHRAGAFYRDPVGDIAG